LEFSDGIATISLIISCYVFYWTKLRKSYSFHLIRVDGVMSGAGIKFILLNSGNCPILVSTLGITFKHKNNHGWTSPPSLRKIDGPENGFKIPAGDSVIFWFDLTQKAITYLKENPEGIRNEERRSYDYPVSVMLEWFDNRAQEHSADAEIIEIYLLDSGGTITHPLQKNHDLYKIAS